MKFNIRKKIIGALATELTIDAIEGRGYLYTTDSHNVLCAGDWRNLTAPLWLSHEFVAAAKIDRSNEDTLFGRVKIFRVTDLTWQSANPDYDDHRAVAQVEFVLPADFGRTEEELLSSSYVTGDDELFQPILDDLIVRTGAEVL